MSILYVFVVGEAKDSTHRRRALMAALDDAAAGDAPQDANASVRAELESEVARQGGRRRVALEAADQALGEVVKLAARAIAAGVPKSKIAELGAVSRPTLDARLRESSRGEERT
jgi:hypothetical protein